MEGGHRDEEQGHFSRKQGGLLPVPFIIGNEVSERIVTTAISANIIIYLTTKYHLGSATSAMILFVNQAAASFLPIGEAVISDAFLGRFLMVTLMLFACTIGTGLLWLTAMIPNLTPPDCHLQNKNCSLPTSFQLFVLFASFAFMSIGTSGIRTSCLAFSEDQFSNWTGPRKDRALRGLFSWYYIAVGGSSIFATTIVVYFQDNMGWKVGFAIPVAIMTLITSLNLVASPLYIKVKPKTSVWFGLVQAIVVAFKNRHLVLPDTNNAVHYYHGEDSKFFIPSNKMRFLNKACMVRSHMDSINNGASNTSHLGICTVEQVECLKSTISVIPMWSTTIIGFLILVQLFGVLQASTMDRRVVTTKFQIPAGSISIFEVVAFTLWSGCYDRYILPLLRRITGRHQVLSLKQRMGIGIFLTIMSPLVASRVEAIRRKTAIKQGLENNASGVVDMSALWLGPQYVLAGLSSAFGSIGQIEFYYAVLPRSMGSLVLALLSLGFGVGYLGATVVVKLVNVISSRGGGVAWVSNNLNHGHYDYYYLVLASLGAANLIYFVICCYIFDETTQNRSLESGEGAEEMREIHG